MTKRKTCNRCKALHMEQYYSECLLGFHIDPQKIAPVADDGICPKPTTNADLIFWLRQKSGRR